MAKKPTSRVNVSVRFAPEIRDAVERIAEQQNRSLSNLVESIVAEWLANQPKPKK